MLRREIYICLGSKLCVSVLQNSTNTGIISLLAGTNSFDIGDAGRVPCMRFIV